MWFIYAFANSLFLAATAESNRVMRLDGFSLNLWRSIFAMLMLCCFLPFMYWPPSILFYAISALDGIISVLAMSVLLNLAATKSSRVSAMYLPISAISTFIVWYILKPSEFINLWQNPVSAMFVIGSLLLACVGVQLIRQNDYGWHAFLRVAPIGLLFGLVDLLTKFAITPDMPKFPAALTYAFVSFAITALGSIPFILMNRKKAGLFSKKMILGGALSGIFSGLAFVFAIAAIATSSNPAYPAIVAMAVPVWLFILHKCIKVPDKASPFASFLIVLSAIGLLFFG